jgi:hypothetical protein
MIPVTMFSSAVAADIHLFYGFNVDEFIEKNSQCVVIPRCPAFECNIFLMPMCRLLLLAVP